ncbi:hypothetical protein BA059_27155 [Mycolicibacterium sp. (ex Dasyatis americana)]|nr:hypothetical protein BA059_27155 [Mycolicibacterium sp. (ex Dasyatis americana)]
MTPNDEATSSGPALWSARAAALAIDVVPGAAVLATAVPVALAVPMHGAWWWVSVTVAGGALLWTLINRLILPSVRGASVGRAAAGITVLRHGSPAGSWWLLVREIAHLADTGTLLLGWLWPLRDARRRTFADLLVRTEVRRATVPAPSRARGAAMALVLTAAAFCAGLAATSYSVVGQYDRLVEASRVYVTENGPGMVEQILSYHPDTIAGDFERARALASDDYRAALTVQQQAVQKSGAVVNQYWVAKSSVLAAKPGEVTMLLFLEGERGVNPGKRYLSASVRAVFVESGSGEWRIDHLDVVTAPQAGQSTR